MPQNCQLPPVITPTNPHCCISRLVVIVPDFATHVRYRDLAPMILFLQWIRPATTYHSAQQYSSSSYLHQSQSWRRPESNHISTHPIHIHHKLFLGMESCDVYTPTHFSDTIESVRAHSTPVINLTERYAYSLDKANLLHGYWFSLSMRTGLLTASIPLPRSTPSGYVQLYSCTRHWSLPQLSPFHVRLPPRTPVRENQCKMIPHHPKTKSQWSRQRQRRITTSLFSARTKTIEKL